VTTARRRRSLVTALAVVGLPGVALAACGSDAQPAPSTFAGDPQDELVRLTLEGLAAQGIETDRACVVALADRLSDEDAHRLVSAFPDGDPDVSQEARGIGSRVLTCADRDDLLDTLVGSIVATAPVSEACVREVLEPLDVTEIAALLAPDGDTRGDADPADLDAAVEALVDCRPPTS